MNSSVSLSVVVPVVKLHDRSGELTRRYLSVLKNLGLDFELVYVLDGEHREFLDLLVDIAVGERSLRIVQLAKTFGEASALTAGFAHTSGSTILTLPAYAQAEADDIPKILAALNECDCAVAKRSPRSKTVSRFNRARRSLFHKLVKIATGQSFSDMGCGIRAFKREVIEETPLYGDQYRFFPLLASRRGFKVCEVSVRELEGNRIVDRHRTWDYLARLLDIFALVFLTRFTKKPLRFFGTIGSIIFALGGCILLYLVVQRLFFNIALADRPALLLTSLMVVLGLQVFALGLLGELIIFTHGKAIKEYAIEKIVN